METAETMPPVRMVGTMPYTRKECDDWVDALKNEQSTWRPEWMDAAKHFAPRGARFQSSQANKGGRQDSEIINSTPVLAKRTLAAGMRAGLSSPSRPWFVLGASDPKLDAVELVKQWLSDVTEIIREVIVKSNIYNVLLLIYRDLGVFGFGCMFVEEDEEDKVRAYHLPVGSFYLGSSARQAVDTLGRDFRMTVKQLVKKFGLSNLSRNVQEAYNRGNREEWFDVRHLVCPNPEYREGALGWHGKKFVSLWWERGTPQDERFLRAAGYDEFPAMAPRWDTTGEDVYGTGPGADCIGDAKALQHLEREKAKIVDKVSTPPMKGPPSLLNRKISLLPGGFTAVADPNPHSTLTPTHEVRSDAIGHMRAEIDACENRINATFFADLFLMLSRIEGGQMTAREVSERREEKLLQLGPVVERLQDELHDPLIDRIFAILLRLGLIPEPPEELAGSVLRVEYVSILAQAQKLVGTAGVERLLTTVLQVATQKPEVVDLVNFDEALREYAVMLGVPPKLMRPVDEVGKMREQRAAAAQQQQQLADAQGAADTAKTLAETPTEGDSALTTMMRSMGAA